MQVPSSSESHLVLIPSYNTGEKVFGTVEAALAVWQPVWVVVDGSDDGTAEKLQALAETTDGLEVSVLPENSGKGAAVLHGIREASRRGYSHALLMDADGQHPSASIEEYMEASKAAPDQLILGKPVFDESAPAIRVNGRKVSNFWANLETLWAGIGDSLFGMRVYPVEHLKAVMEGTRWARRFDFDPEVAVRLVWRGLKPLNIPTPVRYFSEEEGGVSQFRYLRDNTLLTWMHLRLFLGFLIRIPMLVFRKLKKRPASSTNV